MSEPATQDCLSLSEGVERDREQLVRDAAEKAQAFQPLSWRETDSLQDALDYALLAKASCGGKKALVEELSR